MFSGIVYGIPIFNFTYYETSTFTQTPTCPTQKTLWTLIFLFMILVLVFIAQDMSYQKQTKTQQSHKIESIAWMYLCTQCNVSTTSMYCLHVTGKRRMFLLDSFLMSVNSIFSDRPCIFCASHLSFLYRRYVLKTASILSM